MALKNQNYKKKNMLLKKQIELGQNRLFEKLNNLDVPSLNISEYNKRYLGTKLANLRCKLELYGNLIYRSLIDTPIPTEEFILVDYGGGSGLFSFLASEMGIGTIIYNDIYDLSCQDVSELSEALNLKLDHVVHGDIEDLISYLKNKSISINAISSYDVIEHIYDIELHFKKLRSLSEHPFRIVYASNTNIENPLYVRSVTKEQLDAEYRTRDKKWGHKERDTLQGFLEVRKNIIVEYAPDLTTKQVEHLAHATRGLIKMDIEKAADEFRLKGKISYQIAHPTNTCDPLTGNWWEHLMEFSWLEQVISKAGFDVNIFPGTHTICGSLLKKTIKFILYMTIKISGRRGMFFAPFYVVCAEYSTKDI